MQATHKKVRLSLDGVSWLLSGARGDSSVLILGIKLHKLGEIEFGLLKNLNLLDEDIFKWEDLGALLCDSLTNLVTDAKRKYN